MKQTIIIEKNVDIPMRDGVLLRADVYRLLDGEPAPVLLTRTPYNKNDSAGIDPARAVQAGYVLVVQDTRGRYASDGISHTLKDERHDGYDSVEWAAVQPWSNGKVGMYGGSYVGATQWLAAIEQPPHLAAIAPFFTAADYYEGWSHQGGAFQLVGLLWSIGAGGQMADKAIQAGRASQQDKERLIADLTAGIETLSSRPMNGRSYADKLAPWFNDWLNHCDYDDYWKAISPREHYGNVSIPVLHVGGWFDCFIGGTLENHIGMSRRAEEKGGSASRLVVGPWCHTTQTGLFLDQQFGSAAALAALDPDGMRLRFFDYWLLNKANGWDDEPAVRYFLMGDNVWKTAEQWPPAESRFVSFYLHSGGRANTRHGDGGLSLTVPVLEPEDLFLFDPRNPVPTRGGQALLPAEGIVENAGPRDQREIETRLDVLCYTSEPLQERMVAVGPVTACIYAASSAKDTDWTVKLVDVYPDGRAINLTDGIVRARYRSSFEQPELLEPGQVYKFEIDMWATANTFLPGHRIRIELSSSNYPRFDVNTNTGGVIAEEEETALTAALNRIYHTEQYPSHIRMSVASEIVFTEAGQARQAD